MVERRADAGTVTTNKTRDVHVAIHIGAGPASPRGAIKHVTVSPAELSAQVILDEIRTSGLSAADLRSRVEVRIGDEVSTALAVATYAALMILAGRRLDVVLPTRRLELNAFDEQMRKAPANPPAGSVGCVQIGAPHRELSVVTLDASGIAQGALDQIRYASRVRLAVGDDIAEALTMLVAVAALRWKPGAERLPYLVRGDEPADADPLPDGVLPAGFDLGTVRAGAFELRRTQRGDDRTAVAEAVAPSERIIELRRAAGVDMALVLTALEMTSPDGENWHCPRPERHRNGDAHASMRIEHGRVRCLRCDAEPIDAVRLVSDVWDCAPGEAVEWLLSL